MSHEPAYVSPVTHPEEYASDLFVAIATRVIDCPHGCLAHIEGQGADGLVHCALTCDADMIRYLIDELSKRLPKQ